jgi:hypothetical protein
MEYSRISEMLGDPKVKMVKLSHKMIGSHGGDIPHILPQL